MIVCNHMWQQYKWSTELYGSPAKPLLHKIYSRCALCNIEKEESMVGYIADSIQLIKEKQNGNN